MKPHSTSGSRPRTNIGSLVRAPARMGFAAAGFAMVGLGVIGAFLPVMPTTIFMIIAAHCFGRSSRRLEAWILDHPRIGPLVKASREHGAIPRRAKVLACAGMTLGYILFWFTARPDGLLALFVMSLMVGSAIYVVSRPEPPERIEPAE